MKKTLLLPLAMLLVLAGAALAQGTGLSLTCPPSFTNWICGGSFAFVNYPAPVATDTCTGLPTLTCTPPSGALFPLGPTVVTCRATNACGQSAVCTFTVTVRPPLLYNGLCHSPLGLAALNVNTNDELEVSGLGATGQDGVRIDLGESEGLHWETRVPGGWPHGASMTIEMRGQVGGSPALLGSTTLESRNGDLQLSSAVPGVTQYEVKLLRAGQVVYQRTGVPARPVVVRGGAAMADTEFCHHRSTDTTWHFVVNQPVDPGLPGSDFILADTVAITPQRGTAPPDSVGEIGIVGAGMAGFSIRREWLMMFGKPDKMAQPHMAQGQATFDAQGGHLTVGNLGSSGQDGVVVDFDELGGFMGLPPVRGYEVALQPVLLATGEEIKTAAYSRLNGEPAAWLGTLALRQISTAEAQLGGECGIFWHIKREEVYRAGQVVGGATIPIADPLSTLKADGAGMPRLTRIAKLPGMPLAFALTFDRTGTFTFHNGTRLIGDEIRVLFFNRPEDAAELSSLDITSTGSSAMTITAEKLLNPLGLACPPDITRRVCSTNPVPVNFPPPVVSGGTCTLPPTVVCVPPSGSLFPPGATTVLCTVTNGCGERAVCSFTVTVQRDNTPPVITCPSNIVLNCLCPGQVIILDFFQATAVDDYDRNPTVVCDPPSLVSSPGVHVVTCTATDDCGNSSRCQFTVTFGFDTTPPVIQCPTNIIASTCSNYATVTFDVSATDACDPNVTVVCVPPSGSLFPLGLTTVTCTATDRCTNASRCTFTVRVRSDATPQLEAEPNDALATANDLGRPQFAVVVGRIGVAGDVDYYRFTALPNARAWITVDTGGQQWAGANSRNSAVALLNGAGGVLETDDNDGSGNGANSTLESGDASAIAGALLPGGTFYVRVSAAVAGDLIAPYRLYLNVTTNNLPAEIEPNNTFLQANIVAGGAVPIATRLGSLAVNDPDWFSFSIPGPSIVHLSLDGDPERDGVGTDVVLDLFRKDGVSLLFSANSSGAGAGVAEGFPYRLSVAGTYYVRVRGVSVGVTGTYRLLIATCPGRPELPLAGATLRANGFRLSWPAASESSVLLATRDFRTWREIPVVPMFDGDSLIVDIPTEPPHQFFLLSPSGGNANDTYHCCDANGQNCSGPVDPLTACDNLLWCYETENSTVCVPQ